MSTLFFGDAICPHWCETDEIETAVERNIFSRTRSTPRYKELFNPANLTLGSESRAFTPVPGTAVKYPLPERYALKVAVFRTFKHGLREGLYYKLHDLPAKREQPTADHYAYCLTPQTFMGILDYVLTYLDHVEYQRKWADLVDRQPDFSDESGPDLITVL